MFRFLKRAFRDWAAGDTPESGQVSPVTAAGLAGDGDILAGRSGNTPVFIGGTREAIEKLKLRPVFTRSTRHRQPHPAEQPAGGRKADQDFAAPPGPAVKPKEGRGLLVLDGPPPDHQPYSLTPEELGGCSPVTQAQVDRASSAAMCAAPYGLGPWELTG